VNLFKDSEPKSVKKFIVGHLPNQQQAGPAVAAYSSRITSTGFTLATRNAWNPTVTMANTIAAPPASTNTQPSITVR